MKLSIVFHIFKKSKKIEEALKAILSQANESVELIIVNDGGGEVFNKILNNDQLNKLSHLKVISFDQNLGYAFSFNEAIKVSTGDFIIFASEETFFHDNGIKTIVDYLEKNSNISILELNNTPKHNKTNENDCVVTQYKNLAEGVYLLRPILENKVFNLKLIKENDIKLKNFYYYPLVFILQLLNAGNSWARAQGQILEFNYANNTYNIYDLLYQCNNVYTNDGIKNFINNNKDEVDYLVVLTAFKYFIKNMFTNYTDKNIREFSIEQAENIIKKLLGRGWRKNKYIKNATDDTPINTYLKKFSSSYKYIIDKINKI